MQVVKSPARRKRAVTISPIPQIIEEDHEKRRQYAVHQPSRLSTVHTTGSSESMGREERVQVEVEEGIGARDIGCGGD